MDHIKKVLNGIIWTIRKHRLMPSSIYHPRYQQLRLALVTARKKAGLTQADIAVRLTMGQSYVSKIERGDCYIDVLTYVDWCVACGLRPGEILDQLEPQQV
ncbi:MAG: hypothetical protein RLZZ612_326 [Pseudomonadota bacterium]